MTQTFLVRIFFDICNICIYTKMVKNMEKKWYENEMNIV